MSIKLSEANKLKLDEVSKTVESRVDESVLYAARNDGEGMHIYDESKEVMRIRAELVIPFLEEAKAIWEEWGNEK